MDMTNDESKAKVLEEAKRADVRLVSLQFVDIFGTVKSVMIPVEHLEEALDDGHGFDGSSIEGFVRIYESDMIAMPNPSTFRVLPWRPEEKKRASSVTFFDLGENPSKVTQGRC